LVIVEANVDAGVSSGVGVYLFVLSWFYFSIKGKVKEKLYLFLTKYDALKTFCT